MQLHGGTNDALSPDVTYDTGRAVYDGSMDDFNNQAMNGTWALTAENPFSNFDGTINTFKLTITYPTPIQRPIFPTSPAAVTIPGGLKYGIGGSVARNYRIVLASQGTVYKRRILDSIKQVPFKSTIENIVLSVKSSGAASSTMSLHKVSNGVDTTLLSETLALTTGMNYYFKRYFTKVKQIDNVDLSFNKLLNKGDFVYFSIDSLAGDVSDLSVSIVLKHKD